MIADESDFIILEKFTNLKCPFFCGLTATVHSNFHTIEQSYMSALKIDHFIDSGIESTVSEVTAYSKVKSFSSFINDNESQAKLIYCDDSTLQQL